VIGRPKGTFLLGIKFVAAAKVIEVATEVNLGRIRCNCHSNTKRENGRAVRTYAEKRYFTLQELPIISNH